MLVTPLRLRLRFVTSIINQFTRNFGLDRYDKSQVTSGRLYISVSFEPSKPFSVSGEGSFFYRVCLSAVSTEGLCVFLAEAFFKCICDEMAYEGVRSFDYSVVVGIDDERDIGQFSGFSTVETEQSDDRIPGFFCDSGSLDNVIRVARCAYDEEYISFPLEVS